MRYPGESGQRQPVHTVYGGAHLFKSDTAVKLGSLAVRALHEHAPDAKTFAQAIGLSSTLAETIYARVLEKLKREAVEDFRIDFEDGYGNRPDDEEDRHAEIAAREVATGMRNGTLPPFIGIRIKPFSQELTRRSVRTLDLFVSTLVAEGGKLPPWFVVT
ncbi:MAG TPA: phosphoenolpyruvate kinase, partial [Thermoanaerobaculia bacterium]